MEYLADAGVAAVSRESIRQILRSGGISWQATETWKASTDPDFIATIRGSWTCTITHRPMGA